MLVVICLVIASLSVEVEGGLFLPHRHGGLSIGSSDDSRAKFMLHSSSPSQESTSSGRREESKEGSEIITRPEESPSSGRKEEGEEVRESAAAVQVKEEEHAKAYSAARSDRADEKYPFIWWCHRRLESVFGKHDNNQLKDWKLWVGLLFWLPILVKRLICGKNEEYLEQMIYAFGLNILILHHLQYASNIKIGLVQVAGMLATLEMVQICWWFHSKSSMLRAPGRLDADMFPPSPTDTAMSVKEFNTAREYDKPSFVCDTAYLDLTLPFLQISVMFIAQCGVFWFYMTSIIFNLNMNSANYLYWLWAFLVMQMTMILSRGDDSVLGNPFPIHDVYVLFTKAHEVEFQLDKKDDDGSEAAAEPFIVSKARILTVGLMGLLCNSIFREIMTYTIPLMLMEFAEPMDFVVYCVGVNFICTLDDMKDDKIFTMIPVEQDSLEDLGHRKRSARDIREVRSSKTLEFLEG